MKRREKDKWLWDWREHELKNIDQLASMFIAQGAVDEESAWEMAQRDYLKKSHSAGGFIRQ